MRELNYELLPTGDYDEDLLVIQNLNNIFFKLLTLSSCFLVIKVFAIYKRLV